MVIQSVSEIQTIRIFIRIIKLSPNYISQNLNKQFYKDMKWLKPNEW